MKIDEFMRALERAQAYAHPGREAAECNSILRELHRRLLDRDDCIRPRERMPLRLVTDRR
jgi:hypothetical protein